MIFQSKALEKEMDRVQSANSKESNFVTRNFDLKVMMFWVLYPIAALWSIFTAGSHLYHHFNSVFSSIYIAIGFTLLISLAIEVGKYFFARATTDDLVEGVVAEDAHHRAAFVMKLIGALACFTFSILLSIKGAPVSADNWKTAFSPIDLISLDSINAYYDQKISFENTSFDKGSESLWNGKPTTEGLAVMQNAQKNKANIEAQRQTALSEARSENKKRQVEYQHNTTNTGNWFTGLAGIGEAICIICLLFGGNYEAGARKNLSTISPTSHNGPGNKPIGFFPGQVLPSSQQSINHKPTELNYPDFEQRRAIGFVIPTPVKKEDKKFQLPVATANEEDIEAFIMAYKHCKKNRDSWLSKDRQGIGRSETNLENAEKWESKMQYYQGRLKELDKTVPI